MVRIGCWVGEEEDEKRKSDGSAAAEAIRQQGISLRCHPSYSILSR
jgi:hypothetical protein